MGQRSDVARETPLAALLERLTPNDVFFVRSHARVTPHVDPRTYRLEIAGIDGEVRRLSLDDLRAMPRTSAVVTLACSGNGRRGFDPVPAGLRWGFGAISTARWDGVRLRDVLASCGAIGGDAPHVVFDGLDAAPDQRRPPFRRSLPIERALDEATIVADTMNGAPIPAEHGGPARLIVGGWTGNHAMKWLRRITLAREPDRGHWMVNDYRIPDANGTLRTIETPAPIAIVASPDDGARVAPAFELHGVAYGEPAPARVRVEIDGVHAGDADVRYDDGPNAWGRWWLRVEATPGRYRVAVRPANAGGAAYAPVPWNAGGYCYGGPHAIAIVVAAPAS